MPPATAAHATDATGPATPLRMALVGCGVIGRQHARIAAEVPDLELSAVIDPQEQRAVAIAEHTVERTGAPSPAVFADLTDALRSCDVDLVAICTPSGTHADLAGIALQAGKHVVIEKPLDVSVAAARDLRATAREHPACLVAVISQHRHDFASLAVHRALQEGRLGRVTSAVANVDWYRTQDYYDSGDWRGTWELDGGGALMNQGVHTLDLLLWFLGEPLSVSAQTARLGHERIAVEDVLVATITFASGALATVHASTSAYPDLGTRVQVHGTDGSAVIADDVLTYFHARDAAGEGTDRNQAHREVPQQPEPSETSRDTLAPSAAGTSAHRTAHTTQYMDIVEAIRTGRAPWVGLEEGFRALTTARALYLSATLQRPVLVADVAAGDFDDVTARTRSAAGTPG